MSVCVDRESLDFNSRAVRGDVRSVDQDESWSLSGQFRYTVAPVTGQPGSGRAIGSAVWVEEA